LPEKTVKNYVSNILAKLGLERRKESPVEWWGLRVNGEAA
jgi:hypothetical protein